MDTTRKLIGAACAGTLLLACGTPPAPVAPPAAFLGADAYYTLGRAEHGARRGAQARQAWQLALQVDPGHAGARNGMAVLLAEQGDYAGAIALWRALVAESAAAPAAERAFLLGNLGYALYLRGDAAEALPLLEQACVLAPHQPLAWEQLAAVLEGTGDTARALRMAKQARTLRSHDIQRDYALAGSAPVAAPVPSPALEQGIAPWPAGLARTELRRAGAVVEVHRVAPASVPLPVQAVQASVPARAVTAAARLRLEISNGNGMRGMAAAWARRLQGPEWQSVRLTNARTFTVAVTRIEYRAAPQGSGELAALARALSERLGLPSPRALPADGAAPANLRIVLGWDQRAALAQAAP